MLQRGVMISSVARHLVRNMSDADVISQLSCIRCLVITRLTFSQHNLGNSPNLSHKSQLSIGKRQISTHCRGNSWLHQVPTDDNFGGSSSTWVVWTHMSLLTSPSSFSSFLLSLSRRYVTIILDWCWQTICHNLCCKPRTCLLGVSTKSDYRSKNSKTAQTWPR